MSLLPLCRENCKILMKLGKDVESLVAYLRETHCAQQNNPDLGERWGSSKFRSSANQQLQRFPSRHLRGSGGAVSKAGPPLSQCASGGMQYVKLQYYGPECYGGPWLPDLSSPTAAGNGPEPHLKKRWGSTGPRDPPASHEMRRRHIMAVSKENCHSSNSIEPFQSVAHTASEKSSL
jgi:hypothetical protein